MSAFRIITRRFVKLIFIGIVVSILFSCSYKRKITATNIQLPAYYSSGMVFQKDRPIHIYGKANPGGTIAVSLENVLQYVSVDDAGNWGTDFPITNYEKDFSIYVEGSDTIIEIKNAILGDLFVLEGDAFINSKNSLYPRWAHAITGQLSKARLFSYYPDSSGINYMGTWSREDSNSAILLTNLLTESLATKIDTLCNKTIGIINNCNQAKFNQQLRDSIFKFDSSLIQKVSSYKLDDTYWRERNLPVRFVNENSEPGGTFWLRKKVYLQKDERGKDYVLQLGGLNGFYSIWFNDSLLTHIDEAQQNSIIPVPARLTQNWANVINIRCVLADSISIFDGPVYLISNSEISKNLSRRWKLNSKLENPINIDQLDNFKITHNVNEIKFPIKGKVTIDGLQKFEAGIFPSNNSINTDTSITTYQCILPCLPWYYKDYMSELRSLQLEQIKYASLKSLNSLYVKPYLTYYELVNDISQQLAQIISKTDDNSSLSFITDVSLIDTVDNQLRLNYSCNGVFEQKATVQGFHVEYSDNKTIAVEAIVHERSVLIPLTRKKNIKQIKYNWDECIEEYLRTNKDEVLFSHRIEF